MPNLTTIISVAGASFAASFVEAVEALTVVLAVGLARGWRPALTGASDCAWAVAAGMGRAWFLKPSRVKLLGRVSGAVLIGGGVWLSLARRSG